MINRSVTTRRIKFSASVRNDLTHYLFKYPAKLHPPAARTLIEQFSKRGDTVLDPFCGSGTVLVEAAVCGRNASGFDIDPVAVFVSKIKTTRFSPNKLEQSCRIVIKEMNELRRPASEYLRRQHRDISESTLLRCIRDESLWVPAIPRIQHWFRRYVIVDLARLRALIENASIPCAHKEFLTLCFASTIRRASNADPVPVSGLEVTSHMRRKDAIGRIIDPFRLFEESVEKSFLAVKQFAMHLPKGPKIWVKQGDSCELERNCSALVDTIITSPPYQNAVDYYRRHTLEMYWLGFARSAEERLALLPRYIGRSSVSRNHPLISEQALPGPLAELWERRMRKDVGAQRANAFKHYVLSIERSMQQMAQVLKERGHAIMVLGNSQWQKKEIPTHQLVIEASSKHFDIIETMWYPLKNRYMSFKRHNGANIDREYVLVFSPKSRARTRSAA